MRRKVILYKLMNATNCLTSKELAIILSVSDRTVRDDIRRLNRELLVNGASIKSSSMGFQISINKKEQFDKYLESVAEENTQSSNVIFEILLILLTTEKWTTVDELTSKLYVSRSSITVAFKEIKKMVTPYNLELYKRPNYGIRLHGAVLNEFDMLLDLVLKKSITFNMISKILNKCNYKEQNIDYTNIMSKICKKHHFEITNDLLENTVTHLQILSLSESFVGLESNTNVDISKYEEQLACEICLGIKAKGYELTKTCKQYLIVQLAVAKQYLSATKRNDNPVITKDLDRIIDTIFVSCSTKYRVNFFEDFDLRMSLALHLISLFTRIRYKIRMKNPLLKQTKSDYPLAYNLAIEVATVFKNEFDVVLQEDELGYFAIYFGLALEKNTEKKILRNILIICASGRATSSLLAHKIKSNFGKYLNSVETTDLVKLKSIDLEEYDYILTTVEITEYTQKQIIQISCLLDSHDIRRIESKLKYENASGKFLDKINEDLFYRIAVKNKTYQEVLKEICYQIPKQFNITDDFYNQVLQRDELNSTAIGNMVAIPHSIDPMVSKTFCSITVLDKPIKWNDSLVQVIVLLGLSKELSEDMQLFYQGFSNFVTNEKKILKLIKNPFFERFKEILEE